MSASQIPKRSDSRLGAAWLLAGVGAVLVAGVVGVATGPVSIPLGKVVRELLDRLPLIAVDSSLSATEQAIVWDIRAPRVVL
ncbi:MAG: iron ABC transporter permease, partial [Actinomycetia bacterium]|nr:iron ABC transporter permease [Actinomycetes bacterium]